MAVVSSGSIQVGSASRFSTQGKPPVGSQFQPDVSQAQLAKPPAPIAYQGLKGGPDFTLEYEANQSRPLDGSNDLLRVLSPFMIQVEPPLIMGAAPDAFSAKADPAGVFHRGKRGAPSAFNKARNRLKDMPGGEQMVRAGSAESFVSAGLATKPAGGAQHKSVTVAGEGPTRIGTPAIADLHTAVDITMQLRALVNTPPLILLINPQSLSMNRTKIQQFSDRTRFGYVFQAWGEEQPKLSISAKCGAFITSGKGVQWASRRDSAAWQNLATAFQFYRHNGYIYDTVGKSNANHMVGALSIHYDGWIYYGNMESFTYSFEETNQLGGIVFDMEFTVNAMVDTSKQSLIVSPMRSPIPSASDPRYHGINNQTNQGPDDLSVGGPGGPQRGGANFYSLGDIRRGAGATTPDGQLVQELSRGLPPGVLVSPRSQGGFVAAPPAEIATAALPRTLTPFGFGR